MSVKAGQVFRRTYRAADGSVKTCETWTIRYYRNGKPQQEATKFKRKTDALNLLKLRVGDIAKGLPVTAASVKLTFDQAVADVVTDYKVNGKSTVAHVERRITKHLTPFFGGRRLSSITAADIRAYIAARQASITREDGSIKAGASNAEINRELAIVKRACRLAVQSGRLLAMPHIPMLDERNIRQGFFERAQFDSVRDRLAAHLQPVVTFAYLTGWRVPSEVLTLEWRNVDRHRGIVRLEPGTTKNDRGRVFPYADVLTELRDVIDDQWKETQALRSRGIVCPYVFHDSGHPIRYFRKAWKTACKAAGCPGRVPHDFRRTAVRNLVRAGVPEKTAMQLTGHLTRSVFDRYDIVNENDLRSAIAKLATAHRDSSVTVEPSSGNQPAAASA
jgi:integrase